MIKEYILKHRDIDVVAFSIDENKDIVNVDILNELFSPALNHGQLGSIMSFNRWLLNRCIPSSRDGIERLIKKYNIIDTRDIMISQYGLSLSDHYWIDRSPYIKKWKDVNFFENRYSEEVGKTLFDKTFRLVKASDDIENDPSSTLVGSLRKMWKFDENDNTSYLLKGGSGIFKQEPFNEYFSTLLLDKLGFDHVPYTVKKDNNNEWTSSCPCITNNTVEMISAKDVARKHGINEDYKSICSLAEKNNCNALIDSINKMIILDYLIDNEDRHWNNFGVLRNAITGEWLGGIPIFDNGYSLWNNRQIDTSYISHSSFSDNTNEDCIQYININKYINNIPNMTDMFDLAFDNYDKEIINNDEKKDRQERKKRLRNGIAEKQIIKEKYIKKVLSDYIDKC